MVAVEGASTNTTTADIISPTRNEVEVSLSMSSAISCHLTSLNRAEDDPMDAPAYRRRANERGDFNSPGRSRTTPLSLSGAQTQFKESIWKLGSSQVRYWYLLTIPHMKLTVLYLTAGL